MRAKWTKKTHKMLKAVVEREREKVAKNIKRKLPWAQRSEFRGKGVHRCVHRVRYIATGGGMVMSLAFYNVLMRALSYKFSVAGRSVSTNATHTFWHCFHLPQSFTIQSQVHQTLLLESPFFSSSFSALPLASLSTTHTHSGSGTQTAKKSTFIQY